jgi:hypothetical protein
MIRKIALASVLAILATAHSAAAIVTPLLQGSEYRWYSCRVLNTDTVAHDVAIKVVQANTGVVKLSTTVKIPPSSTRSVWGYADSIAYCDVSGIAKRYARVTFCLETNLGTCVSLVTVP